MAEAFKTEFAISDKLILLNLHNAAYKKMKPLADFKIKVGGEDVDCFQHHDKVGDIVNSGCKNGLKAPDKETFVSPTSTYELGLVVKVGSKEEDSHSASAAAPGEMDDKTHKETVAGLRKAAIVPIRSYMTVFVGKDAGNKIKEGDVQVEFFADPAMAAKVMPDFTIGDVKKRHENEQDYALCKIRYSVGLQKK